MGYVMRHLCKCKCVYDLMEEPEESHQLDDLGISGRIPFH